jgi:hypothetical protein
MLIPGAEQSMAHIYGRSLVGFADSNPAGDMNASLLSLLCVVR